MGLNGGGGGGILGVGNSFTGPAQALEIISDHAYAYSGLIVASTSPSDALNFTSGNYYFFGTLQLNAPADDDAPGSVRAGLANIKLNDSSVAILNCGTDSNDVPARPNSIAQQLVIPPYTNVVVEVESDSDAGDMFLSIVLTGRIYRG